MIRSHRLLGGLVALGLTAGCLAAPGPASAAPGDLPRLQAGAPTGIEATWFDDHSLGGDDHLSWSFPDATPYSNTSGQPSQTEPQEIRFRSTITNAGPGALQLCSYAAGGGWMGSFQTAPGGLGACPTAAPNSAQAGWARYVIGGHDTGHAYNRWHQTDLERFAMVPVDHPSAPTVWDSAWGSCMDLGGPYPDCPTSAATTSLSAGIAPGATKVTQDAAPDEQVIPISHDLALQLPDGMYQVVDIVNPYRAIAESGSSAGSVACANFQFVRHTDAGREGLLEATPAGTPATCLLPTSLPPAVSPGGRDPMAGSFVDPCFVGGNGHCWSSAPHSGPFTPARTNATGTPMPTSTVTVAQGAALGPVSLAAVTPLTPPADPDPPADPGPPADPNPPSAPAAPSSPAAPAPAAPSAPAHAAAPARRAAAPRLPLPALRGASARAKARSALLRTFGRLPSSAKVSCVNTGGATARCSVHWRRSPASYRGTLRVWLTSDAHRVRWVWSARIRRTSHGKVRTITRPARTGGTVAASTR